MDIKKIFQAMLFMSFLSTFGFAESFGKEILRKSDLSFEVPFNLTAGELRNYAKADYGVEIKFGTELAEFNSHKGKVGLCSTYFYNKYAFKREEIKTFYVRGFTEGLWIDFPLPKDFFLRSEFNLGLGVTKLKAESIYERKLDNNYNSLIVGINGTVRRKFLDTNALSFWWNGGVNVNILKEESTTNTDIGILAGITLKAGKQWR